MQDANRFQRSHAFALFLGLLGLTALVAHAATDRPQPPSEPPAGRIDPVAGEPRIEAAFVLDTTGSMSGLIEGAKQKIWSIANQMAAAQPAPEIRMALIGYRDRGDAYVTKVFDLTEDLDAISAELRLFSAGGGGDGPESVNQALHEAVTRLSWSDDPQVYRVVFLVGDAPPHMDYADDVAYPETLRLAGQKDIRINTVQCGNVPHTAEIWRAIAEGGRGEFAAIDQDGAMVAVATPMDEELASLNRELNATVLPYGSVAARKETRRKAEAAASAPDEAAASRLGFLSKLGGRITAGAGDLLDAVRAGAVVASELPTAVLPEPMRDLDDAERDAYVAQKLAERERIQRRVDALSAQRDAYVEEELAEKRAAGEAGGFDLRVLETIRAQAAEKGIAYESRA